MAEGEIGIAVMGAQLDNPLGARGLDQPGGEGPMPEPGAFGDIARLQDRMTKERLGHGLSSFFTCCPAIKERKERCKTPKEKAPKRGLSECF